MRTTSPLGSLRQTTTSTTRPNRAKAYIGPASPIMGMTNPEPPSPTTIAGRTKKGASAGPITVPSPWAEASSDIAWVRCSGEVRSAT